MRIACITGSRADWNGLGMVAMALRDAGHDVLVIATGQHGAPGESTLGVIEADGFRPVVVEIPLGNEPREIASSAGAAAAGIGRALNDRKPDLAIVVGDRYEILGAATAAALLRIPIVHVAGGDVTEGSIDNRLRYAITALAELHFPTNYDAFERLMRRTMPTDAVYLEGSPALDRIAVMPRVPVATLLDEVGLKPRSPNIIVSFHPATANAEPTRGCIEMLAACKDLDGEVKPNWILLGSNADAGGSEIDRLMLIFKSTCEDRSAFVANLPSQLYYSALECDLLIGNSSAGLYEAPSFGIPVVNIGDRQKGRLSAANVRTCAPTREAILHTMKLQLAEGRKSCANPYGDGQSAPRIAKIIGEVFNASKPR